MDNIYELIDFVYNRWYFVFNKLFSLKEHNKQEVVTAFTGLLELSRRSKVTTNQEKLFDDIIVEKVKKRA